MWSSLVPRPSLLQRRPGCEVQWIPSLIQIPLIRNLRKPNTKAKYYCGFKGHINYALSTRVTLHVRIPFKTFRSVAYYYWCFSVDLNHWITTSGIIFTWCNLSPSDPMHWSSRGCQHYHCALQGEVSSSTSCFCFFCRFFSLPVWCTCTMYWTPLSYQALT